MPLHEQHFSAAVRWVHTFCAIVFDTSAVTIAFVLSSDPEQTAWRAMLSNVTTAAAERPSCSLSWVTSTWRQVQWARDKHVIPCEKSLANTTWDDGTSLRFRVERKKWRIVTLKKLYGLLYFNFSRTLVIDAEARIVKRFSIAGLFSTFFSRPSIWYTRRRVMTKSTLHSIYGTQMPSAVLLSGLLEPPSRWKNTSELAASLGVPEGAFFLDVQHWFFEREWCVTALETHVVDTRRSDCTHLCTHTIRGAVHT